MSSTRYESPLADRYASRRMQELWSPASRHRIWRRLWAVLAREEARLGVAITEAQVAALERAVDEPVDYARVQEHERRTRHDVMAHVHALAEVVPEAGGIIHLGATSCFVTDNAELVLMRDGLGIVSERLVTCISRLADFAREHAHLPTLGFTHLQPAQPTTVGKRACLWIQDLLLCLEEVDSRAASLRLRGAKGTTGTQVSYLELLGDSEKVKQLDAGIAAALDFPGTYDVTGQTYPRIVDSQVVGALSLVGQAAAKLANDIRILAHLKEVEEPFESGQIGSSAMAYKRNPMRCERINSLARALVSLAANPPATASAQMLERTLDDSANRRMVIPEAFLLCDSILRLVADVAGGLVVYPRVIERRLAAEIPFLATEAILMAAVTAGGDRQALHERIRKHSMAAGDRVKRGDGVNDLLERIAGDSEFAVVTDRLAELTDPGRLIGRAPEQVEDLLSGAVGRALAGRSAPGHDDERIEV